MAKTKTRPGLVDEAPGSDLAPVEMAQAAEQAEAQAPQRWRVTLSCPTPLAHRTLEVSAPSEEAATQAFYQANGICGSCHPHSVERV